MLQISRVQRNCIIDYVLIFSNTIQIYDQMTARSDYENALKFL